MIVIRPDFLLKDAATIGMGMAPILALSGADVKKHWHDIVGKKK